MIRKKSMEIMMKLAEIEKTQKDLKYRQETIEKNLYKSQCDIEEIKARLKRVESQQYNTEEDSWLQLKTDAAPNPNVTLDALLNDIKSIVSSPFSSDAIVVYNKLPPVLCVAFHRAMWFKMAEDIFFDAPENIFNTHRITWQAKCRIIDILCKRARCEFDVSLDCDLKAASYCFLCYVRNVYGYCPHIGSGCGKYCLSGLYTNFTDALNTDDRTKAAKIALQIAFVPCYISKQEYLNEKEDSK